MRTERAKYIKRLMEKYSIYDERELHSKITHEEYNKLIELELNAVREA